MGSVLEKIREVRGGSKTSTNKKDLKDMSDELIVRWNGPNISKCDSVVIPALNLHFKSGPWHFTSSDVRSNAKASVFTIESHLDKSLENIYNIMGGFTQELTNFAPGNCKKRRFSIATLT